MTKRAVSSLLRRDGSQSAEQRMAAGVGCASLNWPNSMSDDGDGDCADGWWMCSHLRRYTLATTEFRKYITFILEYYSIYSFSLLLVVSVLGTIVR